MTVLCGVDGSPVSELAAEVGEAVAARMGVPSERIQVEEPADEALLEAARARQAALLVVGHAGRRGGLLSLGSTAGRVCQAAELPVLVVRDADPLLAWAAGERALRVAVLVGERADALEALRWTAALGAVGPVELSLIHLIWPLDERPQPGLDAPIRMDQVDPAVRIAHERELAALAREAGVSARPVVCQGLGRSSDHLIEAARERGVDLIVLGTVRRGLLDRLWSGSVTHGVVRDAYCSVAAIPARSAARAEPDRL